MRRLTFALDAMGGDFGPRVVVPASLNSLKTNPELELLLFGDMEQIQLYLPTRIPQDIQARLHCINTPKIINSNDDILLTIKNSHNTSLRLAIEAVRDQKAEAVISGGDTAVLMGLSKILLSTIDNIHRPALTSYIPVLKNQQQSYSVFLDLGANIEVSKEMLCQFAEMGSIFATNVLQIQSPTIALLNIGTEPYKGSIAIKEAAKALKERTDMNFIGYIESNDILSGKADVIVSDGFSSNMALKSMEGTMQVVMEVLHNAVNQKGIIGKLKKIFMKYSLQQFFDDLSLMRPDRYNGAILLGLTAIAVKSHGSSDINAYTNAINQTIKFANLRLPTLINKYINLN